MTIEIRITGERLGAMDDNDMSVYATGDQVYWANRPNYSDDRMIATPADFYDANGIGRDDVRRGGAWYDEELTLTVNL